MMKEEAKRQLQEITVNQIKEVLKEKFPVKFDKMIVSENQTIKRMDAFLANFNYQIAKKKEVHQLFPLSPSFSNTFQDLIAASNATGNKIELSDENILHKIKQIKGLKETVYSEETLESSFDYPFLFVELKDELAAKQPSYFMKNNSFSETCDDCVGEKYTTCSSCDGTHQWNCDNCAAKGQVTCHNCAGKKSVDCSSCNGSNKIKCRKCGGDGKLGDGVASKLARSAQSGRQKDKFFQERTCGKCSGKGQIACSSCSNGKVTCSPCSGNGKITCSTCSGKKKITCTNCYGDKSRYGLVDCSQCHAQGEMASFVYVQTNIEDCQDKVTQKQGDTIDVTDTQLWTHFNQKEYNKVYQFLNDGEMENHDDFSRGLTTQLEQNNNLSTLSFPKLVKEEIAYCLVPVIEFSYKHLITNTEHNIQIINFWNNPEIIFLSEPELLKQNLGNVGKMAKGFFGKLFKTKSHKEKDDRKKSIRLMIYLANADGVIDEGEKVYLSEQIKSLDGFTNAEKADFFNLMDLKTFPELTAKDVQFSTKAKAKEVLQQLKELALADGELEDAEKQLLAKIESLM